jgi:diguanylate cyclase (GGDEF)-like protein/PAS domain S-box-containing protein
VDLKLEEEGESIVGITLEYLLFSLLLAVVFLMIHLITLHIYRKELLLNKVALRLRKPFYTAVLSIVILHVTGTSFANMLVERERDELRTSVESLAVAYGGMLSQFDMEALKPGAPLSGKYYDYLNGLLNKWMLEQPLLLSMYVLKKDQDGRNYFALAPETDYDGNGLILGYQEESVPIGTYYESYIPELEQAFKGRVSTQQEPTTDTWGLSLSTFAPVRNPDGRVSAVIGIDLDGNRFYTNMRYERWKGFGLLLIPYGLIMTAYWMFVRSRMERLILSSKQQELALQEEKYRTLSDSNVEGMVIHRAGVILEVNRATCSLFGYTNDELIGSEIYRLVHPEDTDKIEFRVRHNKKDNYKVRGLHKDGTLFVMELYVNLCMYNGHPSRAVAIRDMSEQKRQEERIYRLAYYDELTGLANKKRFLRSISSWLSAAEGHHAAVFFMDLNKFKMINDSFGHSVGDLAMKECAERLMGVLPESGKIARWGSDEFIVLLPDVNGTEEAAVMGNLFLSALEKPVLCQGVPITIGTSVGISLYPMDGTDEETLIRKADTAMYMGKKLGSNSIHFFDSILQEKAASRVRMEQDLRIGMAMNQFELHYQPQVLMDSGEIVGAEALIRWKHPHKGYIPPMEFIPLAEETGLILELGDWVLKQACLDMRMLQEKGLPPLRIAVNLSAIQFGKEDLAHKVKGVLDETGLPASQLELEITETMMMDPKHALGILQQLKGLGVRISIDDFGTGYSSLHYLNRFPIDKLKIDRSFVTDLDGGEAPITTAIISLARTMSLETIAEGVETSGQAEQLLRLGCPMAQGYLYYKPMNIDQLSLVIKQASAG